MHAARTKVRAALDRGAARARITFTVGGGSGNGPDDPPGVPDADASLLSGDASAFDPDLAAVIALAKAPLPYDSRSSW